MYVKLGMFFKSEIDAPDFGSISMYFVGPKEQGYVEDGNKKIRKYTLLSTDLNKLNNITNALDGSEALTVDTGNSYTRPRAPSRLRPETPPTYQPRRWPRQGGCWTS